MGMDIRRRSGPSVWDLMEQMLESRAGFPTRRGEGWMGGAQQLPMNVWETADSYQVIALAPGVDPSNVRLTAVGGTLTVEGEVKVEAPESAKELWIEFGPMRFQRTIQLPDAINAGGVEAEYRNGLLSITIPKAEHAKPRQIQVKASDAASQPVSTQTPAKKETRR